jgi:uncharacterized RDD family membrane protein YckC
MTQPTDPKREDGGNGTGVAARVGRFALRPVLAVAHAGRQAIADEAERAIDGVMAGPLPEAVGRSIVVHRVPERVVAAALAARTAEPGSPAPALDVEQLQELLRRALADPRLEQAIAEAIRSSAVTQLAEEITQSPAFKRTLTSVLASPELRHALERQTAGFGTELAAAARTRARRADDGVEAEVRKRLRRPREGFVPGGYAGVGTRGIALGVDALLIGLVFVVGGALIGLIGSLFGGLKPEWLVGLLAGISWLIVVSLYFVGFWSLGGQTPGMRLVRVRVRVDSDGQPSLICSLVRLVGLALAIIPLFAGFLPVLVDDRRRALQDYLAGTTVVYEPEVGEAASQTFVSAASEGTIDA